MKKIIALEDREHPCALLRTADGYELQTGERRFACAIEALGDGRHRVRAGEERREVHIAQHGDHIWIHVDGRAYALHRINPLDALAARGAGGGDSTLSPMPGTILTVQVQPGDAVEAGQVLLTMESMKLEVTITAPHDGEIAEVLCAPGQTVPVKAALLRFADKETQA
ncbi:biotin/lipoyl-containing protein [Algiphilus sp. W345]|uniref:Biotin/lipoyl-containing protein n=1 Tax=Banduia mediterranea TaxID=3075609 RepID=A0ABU2WEX4_9GAMM|nr:biotin/lipoyl-containing protein [Algiphilus sp. W345]MDT0496412.1 biotin/lipoyl-containing protein [Algiphilus sp. W345]